MFKKITLVASIAIITPAFASNYIELINSSNYSELKYSLYKEQPNVLERQNGHSILDFAIAKKDKRAAIIIADYNNRSFNERRLSLIEIQITELSLALENSNEMHSEIPEKIKQLNDEKDELLKTMNNNTQKHIEDKLQDINPSLKILEDKINKLELSNSNKQLGESSNDKKMEAVLLKLADLESITSKNTVLSDANNQEFSELSTKINLIEQSDTDKKLEAVLAKLASLEKELLNMASGAIETSKLSTEFNKTKEVNTENSNNINDIKKNISQFKSSLTLLSLKGENIDGVELLINSLEKRVKSLEGKVMPINIKNATINSRDIFKESISLDLEN